MKRSTFERIEEVQSFEDACWRYSCTTGSSLLFSREELKEFVIDRLRRDDWLLALHVLIVVYNEKETDWFYYDESLETICTPIGLRNVDDFATYIGFSKED